jgi:GDP-4-dehydro-6-deoxy-D-mannose reductase
VAALVDQGWEVTGCGRRPQDLGPRSGFTTLDISDVDALTRLITGQECDVVFHLAATVTTVSDESVMDLYQVNTLGVAAVLEAARRAQTVRRVVFASSAFAYGTVQDGADSVDESTPLLPRTPYGASKAAAEQIALQWGRQTGIDVVMARAFQMSGPGHVGDYALPSWARQLAVGTAELRVGNLDVVRDYLDVRDASRALLALEQQGLTGTAYNVGSGQPVSMRELLLKLMVAFDHFPTVKEEAGRAATVDQPVLVAGIGRIREHTGWRPRISTDEMISSLAATTVV